MMKNIRDLIDIIDGKNILIVSPGGNLREDFQIISSNKYDVVCHFKDRYKNTTKVVSKIDILYHNMNPSLYDESDLIYFKENNILLVAKMNEEYKKDGFEKHNKRVGLVPLEIENDFINKCRSMLGFEPLTGVLSILHFLSMSVKSVTVIGMDFYDTAYVDNTLSRYSLENLRNSKFHKPEEQFLRFKDIVSKDERFIPIGKLKKLMFKDL